METSVLGGSWFNFVGFVGFEIGAYMELRPDSIPLLQPLRGRCACPAMWCFVNTKIDVMKGGREKSEIQKR